MPVLSFEITSHSCGNVDDPTLNARLQLTDFLTANGFSAAETGYLFHDPRFEIYPEIAFRRSTPPSMDRYSSVLFQNGLSLDVDRLRSQHSRYFKLAHNRYGVEAEAILAILKVETQFGKILGSHSVFNILCSLALSDNSAAILHLEALLNEKYHYLTYDNRQRIINDFLIRVIEKADYARYELLSLVTIAMRHDLDIHELRGSYAGAFGLPQFMPSSVLRWGVDGNQDGVVNLFDYPDAIMSIANYLSKNGWASADSSRQTALLRYNNSQAYVANVLKTAVDLMILQDCGPSF